MFLSASPPPVCNVEKTLFSGYAAVMGQVTELADASVNDQKPYYYPMWFLVGVYFFLFFYYYCEW
jgi:hypothetical protein